MNKFPSVGCFLALSAVLSLSPQVAPECLATEQAQLVVNVGKQQALSPEAAQDYQRIMALREAKNLAGLDKIGEEIQAKWSQKDSNEYFALILTLCSAIGSPDYGLGTQTTKQEMVIKYANLALQKTLIPEEVEAPLLLWLSQELEVASVTMESDRWSDLRREKVEARFNLLQRIQAKIKANEKEDPGGPVFMNLAPRTKKPTTLDNILFSGMRPEDIKDEEIRRDYQQALRENGRKFMLRNERKRLTDLQEEVSRATVGYVVDAYSLQLPDLPQLEEIFKKFDANEDLKTKILTSLKKRTSDSETSNQPNATIPTP